MTGFGEIGENGRFWAKMSLPHAYYVATLCKKPEKTEDQKVNLKKRFQSSLRQKCKRSFFMNNFWPFINKTTS